MAILDPNIPIRIIVHDSFHNTILDGRALHTIFGLSMIWGGLKGIDPTPIPRELPPGTGEEDESNSEVLWNGNQSQFPKITGLGQMELRVAQVSLKIGI